MTIRDRGFSTSKGKKSPSIQIVKQFNGIILIRYILYYIVFGFLPPFTTCIFKLFSIHVTLIAKIQINR